MVLVQQAARELLASFLIFTGCRFFFTDPEFSSVFKPSKTFVIEGDEIAILTSNNVLGREETRRLKPIIFMIKNGLLDHGTFIDFSGDPNKLPISFWRLARSNPRGKFTVIKVVTNSWHCDSIKRLWLETSRVKRRRGMPRKLKHFNYAESAIIEEQVDYIYMCQTHRSSSLSSNGTNTTISGSPELGLHFDMIFTEPFKSKTDVSLLPEKVLQMYLNNMELSDIRETLFSRLTLENFVLLVNVKTYCPHRCTLAWGKRDLFLGTGLPEGSPICEIDNDNEEGKEAFSCEHARVYQLIFLSLLAVAIIAILVVVLFKLCASLANYRIKQVAVEQ